MQDEISIETICILNDIMNFFPAWKKKIDDDIIWPEFANKCLKYTPFINYDKDKFTKLIVARTQECYCKLYKYYDIMHTVDKKTHTFNTTHIQRTYKGNTMSFANLKRQSGNLDKLTKAIEQLNSSS